MKFILVFIGGGLGSVLRFLIGITLKNSTINFPYGTFLVNILGCFIIGIVLSFSSKTNLLNEHHKLLLATGFCGGFTTFSSFAYENQLLLKSGDFITFAMYTIGSLVIGITMIFTGIYVTKFF